MIELVRQRQFFAEEIEMCANVRTAALVEAFAAVSREAFLPPGPWTIRGEGETFGTPRITPAANPRHVNHNVSVAIDVDRQLFNGAPTAVAPAIDALGLTAGSRVLHIGCGLGYYTAIIAHVVGREGRVAAVEVDDDLATKASTNLASLAWISVQQGNASPLARIDPVLLSTDDPH